MDFKLDITRTSDFESEGKATLDTKYEEINVLAGRPQL